MEIVLRGLCDSPASGDNLAKRFTDTQKWDHEWIVKLPQDMKLAWVYILDRCDHAGIWIANFTIMNASLGTAVTLDSLLETFKEKLTLIGSDKIFIPSFLAFQYGKLNPLNKVHKSVLNRLNELGIQAPSKPLASPLLAPSSHLYEIPSPLLGAKEREMDKDKDKEKGEGSGEGAPTAEQLAEMYKATMAKLATRLPAEATK